MGKDVRNVGHRFRTEIILLLICLIPPWVPSWADDAPGTGNREFLDWFWKRPLAEQKATCIFPSRLCRPLDPETCGLCHKIQSADWPGSRHAQAMGPGAMGQFLGMERDEWQGCLDCHAPLREQSDDLARYLDEFRQEGMALDEKNPPIGQPPPAHGDRRLDRSGVACPVCHVRAGRWHGPPRREGFAPLTGGPDGLPHRGWISTEAFGDSRFCAACHQFPENGFALNGKPLENTYEEWRASPPARAGVGCQDCHMPDRRHLFRGIHDPETVRAGAEAGSGAFSVSEGQVSVEVFLANTGTGHRLPTYVTPEIRLEAWQEDAKGARIPDTEEIKRIARGADLQLTTEYFDTRLAPGERAALEYKKPLSPRADRLATRVYVEPDAFYTRIYETLLEMELEAPAARMIRQALEESRGSGFAIHEEYYPVPVRLPPER